MTSKEGKKWGKVCGKYEGDDGNGESVLTGFGSSSGSSTEETADQQEFLAELTRQMAENMFQEDENISSNSLPPDTNKKTTTHFYPNENLQSKIYKHERKMKEYGHGSKSGGGFHTTALQNGSGMRVVFLGKTGSKSGSSSSGTGVFIPHRISSGTGVFIPHGTNNLTTDHQARKKSGCSTALIPERVLLTLKQHFEKRNASGDVKKRNGDEENQEDERLQMQEKPNKSSVVENNNDYEELQLPQEWTY